MTLKTLGMGIAKLLTKKRKVLTVDKGALRISQINKKLKKTPRHAQQDIAEDHAQEVADIYAGKWKGKKVMAAKLGYEAIKYIFTKALTKKGSQGIARIPGKAYDMRMKELVDAMATKMRNLGYDVNKVTEKEVQGLLDSAEALAKQKTKAFTSQLMKDMDVPKKGTTITDERGRTWDFKTKEPKVYKKGDKGYDEITEKLGITAKPGHPLTLEGKADLKVVPKVTVDEHITFIKSKEPIESMKEANKVIKREGRYKNLTNEESQKILKDTDDHIFERDIKPDEFDPDYASGGRVPLMYGGDPGFAFEYGGSWADWHDQHRNTMPVEQYIQTKLPKARLPFREMQSGGLAYMLGEPTHANGGEVLDKLRTRQAPPPVKGDFIEEEPSDFDPNLEDVINLLLKEKDKRKVEKAPYIFEGEQNPWRWPYNDDPTEVGPYAEQWVSHGGSVGHAPWLKPTGQRPQQPQPQPQGGAPGGGRPDPMKAPRGLPSLAPRTMDPQYMQQQMMQKAMMGQGQQRMGMEEGGPTPEQFQKDYTRKKFHELMRDWEEYQRNYEREERQRSGIQEAAQGGRIGFGLGSLSRRTFLKMMAAIAALPLVGRGVTKVAPKVIPKVTETVARGVDGMPIYITDLIEVVKAKGIKKIIDSGINKYPDTLHSYKGVDVIEDGAGNIRIKSDKSGVATDSYTGKTHEGIVQENHIQIERGQMQVKDEGLPTQKAFREPDEYIEGSVRPDMDGKMKDFEEGLDEAIHSDFKKIADELHEEGFYYPLDAGEKLKGKASGGRVPLGGGGIIKILKKALKKFKNVHDVSNAKIENYIMDQGYKLGKYYKKNPGKGLSHSTAVGTGVLISRHLDRQKRGKKASGGVAQLLGE